MLTLQSSKFQFNRDFLSIDGLLLYETQGVTMKDQFVLFCLKNIYPVARAASMLILGNEKGDFSFKGFFRTCVKVLALNNLLFRVNISKYGFQTYCRTRDNFNDFTIMTGHEHDLLELFAPKRGDIVVDVGAHIGLYSITGSKRVGPKGKVIAIEADPDNFEILNRNIRLNNLTNIISLNCIAYSKEMEMQLDDYNSILSGGTKEGLAKQSKRIAAASAVHVNTLDNLLQQKGIDKVNWIKIDVEGAELEVLRGAHNVLSNSKDISILIEIHGISDLYKPTLDLLQSYNFKIVFEKTFDGYRRQNMKGAKNILLRKSRF
jgi:FkbM family methyltransferase